MKNDERIGGGDDVILSKDGNYALVNARRSRYESFTLVALWDLKAWKKIHTFKEKSAASSFAVSPDGNYILIGNKDRTILYDIKTWQKISDLPYRSSDAILSPDGNSMLTQYGKADAFLWDISCIHKIKNMLESVTLEQNELLRVMGESLKIFMENIENRESQEKKSPLQDVGRIYANQKQMEHLKHCLTTSKMPYDFLLNRQN